jgi:hypothetical protein
MHTVTKKVVGVFVRFSCAFNGYGQIWRERLPSASWHVAWDILITNAVAWQGLKRKPNILTSVTSSSTEQEVKRLIPDIFYHPTKTFKGIEDHKDTRWPTIRIHDAYLGASTWQKDFTRDTVHKTSKIVLDHQQTVLKSRIWDKLSLTYEGWTSGMKVVNDGGEPLFKAANSKIVTFPYGKLRTYKATDRRNKLKVWIWRWEFGSSKPLAVWKTRW